ncbi:Heme exporter protein D [Bibersteinia trehalosi USDA-ARS-USMARC-188]|uniref:Heme exporter protein D n=5 Tax=Bibersteinia trehalosi TaxID=47735 RepID=W0R5I0_BIBTR|nr:heme exporter protein CcmD [Bibersteinia trehalosi]AGH38039.1 Heme exporter protein D [Bibersteinia trehalosi USDA-ARS-USMARC-192]AHG82161.1 Heme exporter protein D [Bibersteinia trehalosi USDA-ARS-USMARC-188]AHG84473.1 Heme exporter protein D [Bibersteinia trehalosi USDA-ARS-USMARC-189]AHG86026.1 Heme exporter protein D [Bibersteinia trehalosi USDA-ARS-USMARC-190]OAQ15444.1 hemagglutination activity protein [Bibersteinia trehalosi Y31]
MKFQFDSISDFFAMGGYGFYVWLAYGITFAAMGLLIWQSKRELQQTLKIAKKSLAREKIAKQQS